MGNATMRPAGACGERRSVSRAPPPLLGDRRRQAFGGERVARSRADREMRPVEELAPVAPRVELVELVGADDQHEREPRPELRAQPPQRVDGELRGAAQRLGVVDREARVVAHGELHHLEAVMRGRAGRGAVSGVPDGIHRTRSSPSSPAASSARRRWARCTGSKVPPIRPRGAGAGTSDVGLTRGGDRQVPQALHLVGLEELRVVEVVEQHRGRVDAPEQVVVDDEGRHAEHAGADRRVGILAELGLHALAGGEHFGAGDAERVAQRLPLVVRRAALGPDEVEDRLDRVVGAAEGDREPQRVQRVERMPRRILHRDAVLVGLPLRVAVGVDALRLDLRRALVLEVLQQAGEQHRLHVDVRPLEDARVAGELEVRERRDEVEVPDASRH